MGLDFTVVAVRWASFLWGALGTLGLAITGMLISIVIGVIGVAIRRSGVRSLEIGVIIFVEAIRNTPFLVQIFFIFFALPYAGVRFDATTTAIIALGINGGAYAIEIIRGGVESVPKGQIEAGLALGLRARSVFQLIVLKPAFRAVYPSLSSQFVLLTLNTSVCTAIDAFQLSSVAQEISGETFRSFEVYFVTTAIYLVLSFALMMTFAALQKWLVDYPA